jgi:hypothetical protein
MDDVKIFFVLPASAADRLKRLLPNGSGSILKKNRLMTSSSRNLAQAIHRRCSPHHDFRIMTDRFATPGRAAERNPGASPFREGRVAENVCTRSPGGMLRGKRA